MAITLATLARRLARTPPAITRAARAEIDKPLPVIRTRVKASALGKLPRSGGLNAWAAAAHLTAQVHVSGNTVTAALKVHRTSLHRPSDLRALDRGRVRHPAWGRRSSGDWSVQLVTPKVYSEPIAESPEWRRAVIRAAEVAEDVICRG
jgi:hypothetical protein